MVQLRVDLASTTDRDTSVIYDQYKQYIEQKDPEYNKKADDSKSLSRTSAHLSILAWRAMLDRSTQRLEKYSFFKSVGNPKGKYIYLRLK